MPDQIKDDLTSADANPQGLDGGLNLKADPTRLAPPVTTRSDNAHYDGIGNVSQLPGFVSSGLNGAIHVYNIHARDTYQPTSAGDVMVHGEFADGTLGYTTSAWAHANGTVVNSQPVLPFTLRTRAIGSALYADGGTALYPDLGTCTFARQEIVGSDGQRAYALGCPASGNILTGKINGFTENKIASNTYNNGNGTFPFDMIGVQQTQNFCTAQAVSSPANTIYIYFWDFNGNYLYGINIPSALTTLADGHFPCHLFNHAGTTFLAYYNTSNALILYDVVNQVGYTTGIATGAPTGGFSVFSPYSHTSSSSSTFLGVLHQNKVYVLSRASSISNFTVVSTAAALSTPSISPTNSSQPLQGTGAMIVNDNQSGVGGSSKFLISIFRAFPESWSAFGSNTSYIALNSLAIDQLTFTANASPQSAGTLTNVSTQYVRFPGGMQLNSRAFTAFPNEAQGAGISQAKQAFCMVKSGAYEPTGTTWNYGQPTYFVVDHAGRIVSRFGDGQAHSTGTKTCAGNGTAGANLALPDCRMKHLGSPLILGPSDSGADVSAMSITLPCLYLVIANLPPPIQVNANTVTVSTQPINPTFTPYLATFSLPAANAAVPAAQAGAYTIISGPLTCIHDGGQLTEANFHMGCPNLIFTPNTSGTTLGGAGTYYYVGVLEWVDDLGQLHRSKPSNPLAYVSAGTFYGGAVFCPIPPGARSIYNVRLRVYRSIANRLNDTNYYYIGANTGYNQNVTYNYVFCMDQNWVDATATTASAPLPTSATAINAQPRVYTAITANSVSNTYPSTSPPPFIWQIAHRGRAFGLAQILGKFAIYYTSPTNQQIAPEWNTFNFQPVPADIGDARSIEAVDAYLYVFGSRYNAYMTGDGPPTGNATGSPSPGDNFSALAPVPTPAGVIGSGSPARVPTGLVFQGFSGIQLLGRDQSISPIGMPVDPLTGRQVGNAGQIYGRGVTLPSLQSVVWPCSNGPALVYSYLTQKFSTWPLLSNACLLAQRIDGTIITAIQPISGGTFAGPATGTQAGCDLGSLQAASYAPIYTPSATAPGLVIETPWILPHGTSGAEARVWNGCLTGTWQGAHILQIEQGYDYEPYSLTRTVDFTTAPRRYQVITQPKGNTRCVAIRFRFTLLPSTSLGSSYLMATFSDFVLFSAQQQGTTRTSANLRS